ncbi:hypothetical protein G6F46_014975 [Rhizopus delemar]|nr:hypothetical protein G6F24_014868 [Rhizopus arrhizus]KAG0922955.1 hypothetical protein G6F32_014451 [Rhizopus arrhizus]KAG1584485.1 hypothetical protein G6F46_014975 [Rhizopus delemar]
METLVGIHHGQAVVVEVQVFQRVGVDPGPVIDHLAVGQRPQPVLVGEQLAGRCLCQRSAAGQHAEQDQRPREAAAGGGRAGLPRDHLASALRSKAVGAGSCTGTPLSSQVPAWHRRSRRAGVACTIMW